MVINHTIKLATLDHIKNKYKWDPSLCDLIQKRWKCLVIIFREELVCYSPTNVVNISIILILYTVYDIPLFQYEREDNRRVDLEVVMVRARKGGRTSWPLPVNKKRKDYVIQLLQRCRYYGMINRNCACWSSFVAFSK